MQSRFSPRKKILIIGAFFAAVVLGGFVFSPESANAQQLIQCESRLEGQTAEAGALPACDLCFAFSLANNITTIAAGILGFVGALMIVVSGFQYVTAAGNEHLIETAKNTLKFAITGIIIVLLAFIIVKTAVVALLGNSSGFNIFGTYECNLPEVPDAPGGSTGNTPTGNQPGNTPTNNTPPGNDTSKVSSQCPSGEKCSTTPGSESFCCDASKGCVRAVSPALADAIRCMAVNALPAQPNFTYQGCHSRKSWHFGNAGRFTDGAHAADYSIRPSASEGAFIVDQARRCSTTTCSINAFFENNKGKRFSPGDPNVTHVHMEVNGGSSCK
jgi:hypothetical protein